MLSGWGARAGVRVILGEESSGDEMEEYTLVPYSRNEVSSAEANYLTTAMVSGSEGGSTRARVLAIGPCTVGLLTVVTTFGRLFDLLVWTTTQIGRAFAL